ncbi:hypothetical protein FB45DRAFT_1135271 [Roridomyces roridus]|uniref:Uncharacterized protein n=1 Tax=Roridomyces roridus TaxID=1738132 RepID=A0AAD7B1L6_9AGAR|nr:hypothetical protein FB45DRAFT_1135271 [Roridomyces roridus]
MTANNPILPGFTTVQLGFTYLELQRELWPTPHHPDRLTPLIKGQATNLNIWTDGDPIDVSTDDIPMEVDTSSHVARYISLVENDFLSFHRAKTLNHILIRQEYEDFLAHVMKKGRGSFFLTGQPGIGKSVGACYFLCHLLASGQSVFFLPDSKAVYYFSASGVEALNYPQNPFAMTSDKVRQALKKSWVLMDSDIDKNWQPDSWIQEAFLSIWFSSPDDSRYNSFKNQTKASLWCMQPWSLEELSALTILTQENPSEVFKRFREFGPIPRFLIDAKDTATNLSILDTIIYASLADSFFTAKAEATRKASNRMFLVKPQKTQDGTLDRSQYGYTFVSDFVLERTMELMQKSSDLDRQKLLLELDQPNTRSAAGILMEHMIHQAFIEDGMSLPLDLGGQKIDATLRLLGTARTFVIETHGPTNLLSKRPLYLQPQSPNFATMDAIIITQQNLILLQSSLFA